MSFSVLLPNLCRSAGAVSKISMILAHFAFYKKTLDGLVIGNYVLGK